MANRIKNANQLQAFLVTAEAAEMTHKAIAERFGCSASTVAKYRQAAGLTSPRGRKAAGAKQEDRNRKARGRRQAEQERQQRQQKEAREQARREQAEWEQEQARQQRQRDDQQRQRRQRQEWAGMDMQEAARILGMESGASWATLKTAYRKASRASHPDMGGTAEAFIRVNTAYEYIKARL